MKRKFLVVLLAIVATFCMVFGFAACDAEDTKPSADLWSMQRVYATAQELGFEGTLEELIAMFKGADGVGVATVEIDESGHLKFTLTGGAVIDCGAVRGKDGVDGKDGIGVKSVEVNEAGHLIVTFTNGEIVDAGPVKGENGAPGKDGENGKDGQGGANGENGKDGQDGINGVGIKSVEVDARGHLMVTLTDNTVLDAGVVAAPVSGIGLEFQKISLENGESGAMVVGLGTAWDTDLVIPDTYMDLPVVKIGDGAFSREREWKNGNLVSVQIPASVKEIGEKAFYQCGNLKAVKFAGESSLTSIGSSAFYDCGSLQNIEIPDGVTSIGSGAFQYCNLDSINLPAMASLGANVFLGTPIYAKESNWDKDGVLYYDGYLLSAQKPYSESRISGNYSIKPGTKVIADSVLSSCYHLTSVEIPNSVTIIGKNAFEQSPLQSVSFEDNSKLTSIGGGAFYHCPALQSIEIPAGVTSIGGYAFAYCYGLQRVSFENDSKLTTIGNGIFRGCSGLTSVNIPDTVTSIGSKALWYCSRLTEIRYNGTIDAWKRIEKRAGWNTGTGNYTIYCTDGTITKDGVETYYNNAQSVSAYVAVTPRKREF